MTKPFTPDSTHEELRNAEVAATTLASLLNSDPKVGALLAKAQAGEISETELIMNLLNHLEPELAV